MAQFADPVIINFLGGLNTAFRVSDVSMSEAVSGENFDLDADFAGLVRRPSLDAIGGDIANHTYTGYAQLQKTDNGVSTLLQANDGNVYEWDLATKLTLVGMVNATARLRGSKASSFALDDYVVITDLSLIENVKRWDGTTFEDLPHNLSSPLKAKYALIELERLLLANVTSGSPTPHVLLGSKISDPLTLTITDRPSSSAAFDDPFFLPMPDLKPINGIEQAFGQRLISTDNNHLYLLAGSDATDFAMTEFHFGSAVPGDESLTNMGNDILLGPPARIETLSGVDQFGDVEADDVSRLIRPSVKGIESWRMSYNRTDQRVYCIPTNRNEMWVLHKNVLFGRQEFSPWSKWTSETDAFETATIMTLIDSNGSSETTYIAPPSGGLYTLNGGTGQDASNAITMKWRTGLIRVPPDDMFNVSGWINYRKLFQADITLRFIFGGVASPTQDIIISIPQDQNTAPVYGGAFYYNQSGVYYGSQFSAVIARQNFGPVGGQASHTQVEVIYSGPSDIQIEEIGLLFQTASTTAAP